ncbi:hypothetical protein SLEP1_g22884 [Rubroshorea leprosula]|uniref:Integrase catalytic domain-containing protein n=1 Tax=Rubroshorea leprosula TaxID=152421 RepID=A0AAV5JAQ4_9ROSI|nr:hypothetical protein SLEP1_g22884 [Rubroshorea leprosula]
MRQPSDKGSFAAVEEYKVPSNLPPLFPPPIPNTFPHVDHAEGGDDNQPHNSAHNSASTANQDVVAAQLAAMQQHESQGQSHIAPAQQPLPNDVTRRLDSLEKLVVEQRGAPPPRHATDSIPHPLNTNITLEPYPAGFRIPQLETYDGMKDFDGHLHAFYSCMQAQNASDVLMCKIFPFTLREMTSAFATKFSNRRLIKKTTFELMRVRQRDGESLKNFMSRFNDAVLEVSFFDQAVGITTVISGLRHERFRDSLLKHLATTFSERVLVDTGSAPDIMYFHCFESLGLDPALLQRYDDPIYGFNNQPVPVEGVLTMNAAFGSGRNYVTPSVSEHALKFNFDATNNMAEYEALLLSLQLALELKINAIQVYSDSQLVVNQINSICEVVDLVMADSLSKFASDSSLSSRSVFVEVLNEPSFMKPRVMEEAMELRKKASRYTFIDGVLYKISFSLPFLQCLNPYEAEYALREVYEGVCGSHIGARTLAHKVLRQGYYWPNIYKDATHFVQRCLKCQFFAHLTHQPIEELTNLVAPWPFAQWGLDFLGPFVKGVGGVTHLIVGVDYFTKWVEGLALSSLTSKKVEDFVFSSIICRYGIPNQIVADNGTQFNCSSFRDFYSNYGIKLQFTSIYHPESNGMVEYVHKCILEGIKPRLEQHKAKWADELNNVLWAYRTTSRTTTGETPYHLAFGTEAVIPIEIGVPSFRVTHFDEGRNGQQF